MSHKRTNTPLSWYQLYIRTGKMRLVDVKSKKIRLKIGDEYRFCSFVINEQKRIAYLECNKKGITWYQLYNKLTKTTYITNTTDKVFVKVDDTDTLYYCSLEFIEIGTDAYIDIKDIVVFEEN